MPGSKFHLWWTSRCVAYIKVNVKTQGKISASLILLWLKFKKELIVLLFSNQTLKCPRCSLIRLMMRTWPHVSPKAGTSCPVSPGREGPKQPQYSGGPVGADEWLLQGVLCPEILHQVKWKICLHTTESDVNNQPFRIICKYSSKWVQAGCISPQRSHHSVISTKCQMYQSLLGTLEI